MSSRQSDRGKVEDWRSPWRNLDFEECLSKLGTDEFKEAVVTRLEGLEVGFLQDLCEAGGSPDWEESAEFDLGDPEERGDIIIDVWFNESIAGGCRDINWHEARRGTIFVEIQKQSGRADVSVERAERNFGVLLTELFYGSFYGRAINHRKATQNYGRRNGEFADSPSKKSRLENRGKTAKNPFYNYESPALTAEL